MPSQETRANATSEPLYPGFKGSFSLRRSKFKRKQAQPRSALSTIDPSRVSKARGKGKTSHPKVSILSDAFRSVRAASVEPSVSQPRRSKRTSKAKDAMATPLSPIHSSKVSKSKKRRPSALQACDREPILNKQELKPRSSSARSAGSTRSKHARNPTRRSARISQRWEISVASSS